MNYPKQLCKAILVFLIAVPNAYSQLPVPFKVRYQSYVNGDMTIIANSITNRVDYNNSANTPYHNHTNKAMLNDEFEMEYIDIDKDETTFSSSSAKLILENQSNKKIIYAGLYWSSTYKYNSGFMKSENKFVADDDTRDAIENIKVKLPNQDNYIDISGEILFDGLNKKEFKDCAPYAVYADLTQQITQLENPFGEYTVANIKATEGKLSGGVASGWTLFIVYEDQSMKGKYITSFDGFAGVTDRQVDINFSGFETLPEGEINAKIALASLEGDNNLLGDQILFQSTADKNFFTLENKLRKQNNFFNSSITIGDDYFVDRNPNGKNTLGYDTCLTNINNLNNSVIGNNANQATIRLKSNGDRAYMFFAALNVEVTEKTKQLIAANQSNAASKETVVTKEQKQSKKVSEPISSVTKTEITTKKVKTEIVAAKITKEIKTKKSNGPVLFVERKFTQIEQAGNSNSDSAKNDVSINDESKEIDLMKEATKNDESKDDISEFVDAQNKTEVIAEGYEKTDEESTFERPKYNSKNSTEIKQLTIENFPAGYYIIANVFEIESNKKNFLSHLKENGIEADSFFNPKNNYNYVYLLKTEDKKEALQLYQSKVNNTYNEDIWILSVNKNDNKSLTNLDD
jgi:hypothetical protein